MRLPVKSMEQPDKNVINKWVFIGGAPRSGTSLLQAILNEHSQCVSPPESHILETFVYAATSQIEKKFKDHKQLVEFIKKDKWIHRLAIDPEEIVKELHGNDDALELFRLYMQHYAARVKKEIMIDGCPINIWFLKKLYIDFPGCYVLHIVRDPRDVVMSTMKAAYTKHFDFPPPQIAKQFMESYLQSERFAHLYGERYLKIYYEELVSDPEKVIKSVCSCLGIEFEKEMLEFHKSSQKVSSEEEVWKENLSKPFLKDNFGKWKTVMTKENIIRVEYICKHFFKLEKQHYSRSAIQKRSNAIKSLSILADYHTTETKRRIRRMMNGRKTKEQLDKMPPYERMRINGYLKK